MKLTIIYPSDYFSISTVDEEYHKEFIEACKFSEFQILFFDYDTFIREGKLKLYPNKFELGSAIYRGWMLKTEQYENFFLTLKKNGLTLINSPKEYEACHIFKNVYPTIFANTPKLLYYPNPEQIRWEEVRKIMKRFLIKDAVKSVKGSDFPVYLDASLKDEELDAYIKKFITLRGNLFTGGITIKEYIDLAVQNGVTNEYRVFIFYHHILSVSRNSNQSSARLFLPEQLLNFGIHLPSNFYTLDWAETKDHRWIIIETGDGQVSGLSPNQYTFIFYETLARLWSQSQ